MFCREFVCFKNQLANGNDDFNENIFLNEFFTEDGVEARVMMIGESFIELVQCRRKKKEKQRSTNKQDK